MIKYKYCNEPLLIRELERLREEYVHLELNDVKTMLKEDIVLLETAMNILSINKSF
ncbi:hypothetical protein [Priestia aryabhattai]|uniref:hypothetical protein n=1 Tax=Priestia aryabhattai TaxID=412384 RepID=UPI001C8EC9A7|nr:hypothetical protein [Priestia aryabhattai]MBY0214491.1 hypothetical protein [Priestia aryabhattai]